MGSSRTRGRTYILLCSILLVMILVLAIVAGSGIGVLSQARMRKGSESVDAAYGETAADYAAGYTGEYGLRGGGGAPRMVRLGDSLRPTSGLKLIYNAQVSVVLDKEMADTFPDLLTAKVRAWNGYVSGANSQRESGRRPHGNITVRVPAERLHELLDWIDDTVAVVTSNLTVDDISEQYVDLEARLTNLRAAETRLGELLAEAEGSLEEILKVEQEIRRVRGDIETLAGRKRYWDNKIAMSTLTVSYRLADVYEANDLTPPSFGDRVKRATGGSSESFTRAMANLAIGAIYALPWLVIAVAALVVALIWRARHRRRKKLRS